MKQSGGYRADGVDGRAPAGVWETAVDVEGWPRWASYLNNLRKQDQGPLTLGSSVRVVPNGMPGSLWTIIEVDPPRSYKWSTQLGPELGVVAGHVVEPNDQGTTATFSLATSGPLGAVLSPLAGAGARMVTHYAPRYRGSRIGV